jgi:hypothetical protein
MPMAMMHTGFLGEDEDEEDMVEGEPEGERDRE